VTATATRGTPYTQALAAPRRSPRPAPIDSARADASLRRRRLVGSRIRDARQRLGLSQEQLGLRLDMSDHRRVSQWENAHGAPDALRVEQLAQVLGQPVHYFYGGPAADLEPAELENAPHPPPDLATAAAAIGELLGVLDHVATLLDRLGRAGEMIDTRLATLRALGIDH
jgi:transcriptional regulator with XRE-family HTH domain